MNVDAVREGLFCAYPNNTHGRAAPCDIPPRIAQSAIHRGRGEEYVAVSRVPSASRHIIYPAVVRRYATAAVPLPAYSCRRGSLLAAYDVLPGCGGKHTRTHGVAGAGVENFSLRLRRGREIIFEYRHRIMKKRRRHDMCRENSHRALLKI